MKLNDKYKESLYINSIFGSNPKTNCECTYGCGAGTTDLIINSDLSLSACDLVATKDRTLPITTPEDIEYLWNNHKIFKKWRGLSPLETLGTIRNFKTVHQTDCHLLTNYLG